MKIEFNREEIRLVYLAIEDKAQSDEYLALLRYLNGLLGIEGRGDRAEFLSRVKEG